MHPLPNSTPSFISYLRLQTPHDIYFLDIQSGKSHKCGFSQIADGVTDLAFDGQGSLLVILDRSRIVEINAGVLMRDCQARKASQIKASKSANQNQFDGQSSQTTATSQDKNNSSGNNSSGGKSTNSMSSSDDELQLPPAINDIYIEGMEWGDNHSVEIVAIHPLTRKNVLVEFASGETDNRGTTVGRERRIVA
jgi:hypothetical protein